MRVPKAGRKRAAKKPRTSQNLPPFVPKVEVSDRTAEATSTGGRPTKYDTAYTIAAKGMTQFGALDIDIAREIGIDISTFYRWKARHAEFREAVTRGREVANDIVEQSLFRNATGWVTHNEKVFQTGYKTRVEEERPGDVKAQELWLRVHKPELYAPRKQLDVNFDIDEGLRLTVQRMVEEDRRKRAERAKLIDRANAIQAEVV